MKVECTKHPDHWLVPFCFPCLLPAPISLFCDCLIWSLTSHVAISILGMHLSTYIQRESLLLGLQNLRCANFRFRDTSIGLRKTTPWARLPHPDSCGIITCPLKNEFRKTQANDGIIRMIRRIRETRCSSVRHEKCLLILNLPFWYCLADIWA